MRDDLSGVYWQIYENDVAYLLYGHCVIFSIFLWGKSHWFLKHTVIDAKIFLPWWARFLRRVSQLNCGSG
jgi:hypothetical protein